MIFMSASDSISNVMHRESLVITPIKRVLTQRHPTMIEIKQKWVMEWRKKETKRDYFRGRVTWFSDRVQWDAAQFTLELPSQWKLVLGGGREKQSAVINTIGNEADPILVSSSFHALESNNSAYMYTRPFYTWMSSAFTGMDSNLVSPYTIAHAEDLTSMISMVSTTKYVWVCELLHGLTQYISYRPTDSHCMLGWGAYSSFPGVMGRGKGRGRRVGWGESWGGGIRGVGGWSYLKLPCFVHFHH